MYSKMQCDSASRTGNSSLPGFQQLFGGNTAWKHKEWLSRSLQNTERTYEIFSSVLWVLAQGHFLLVIFNDFVREWPAYWTLVYLASKLSNWLAQQENLFVDFCTALFSNPVIVGTVSVRFSRWQLQSKAFVVALFQTERDLGMSLCIMGYLKVWFWGGGIWVLSFQGLTFCDIPILCGHLTLCFLP